MSARPPVIVVVVLLLLAAGACRSKASAPAPAPADDATASATPAVPDADPARPSSGDPELDAWLDEAAAALAGEPPRRRLDDELREYLAVRVQLTERATGARLEANTRSFIDLCIILASDETRGDPATRAARLRALLTDVKSRESLQATAPEVRAVIEQSFPDTADLVLTAAPEAIAAGVAEILTRHADPQSPGERVLRAAAAAQVRARGGSRYEALREVRRALRERHPAVAQGFVFAAEPGVERPPELAACPPANPRYAPRDATAYFDEPAFEALGKLPDAELPDGALLPLARLAGAVTILPAIWRDGNRPMPTNTAEALLARYGAARALPCLLEVMTDPARHLGQVGGTRVIFDDAVRKLAAGWPEEAQRTLYRVALRAGWRDWERDLASRPALAPLVDELADTPYGHFWE